MNTEFETLSLLATDLRFDWLRGRRVSDATPVLLKQSRGVAQSAVDLSALRNECTLAAGLPSLAALWPQMVEIAPRPLMVLEDPGGTLLSQALNSSPLSIASTLAIGLQLASTLAQLHDRGVVHRGIRPDVILCEVGVGRAWLIDFGDAVDTDHAAASPRTTSRLIYVAPEQTGRIDAVVDARSDLYALGIVLYEMLTGAPPHRADTALEWVHWHIAGTPRAPDSVDVAIPTTLSTLVMKLLSKSPDERYQSAKGLAQDLARCAREWAADRQIAPFLLGRHDIGGHLVIAPRLYGREREVHMLLDAFEQACSGGCDRGTLVLVEGYSGIGKTALIQQLVKPILRRRGYFISGKFDQVARGVPFDALIQAFRGLVRQWLTESEAQLAQWRITLMDSLGPNGGVLTDVIPEIEFIIGPQATPPALGSTERLNRFQRVFQSFVTAVARPEHPLVMFLDDLQWADAATLGLLEPLLTGDPARRLLLMGAYRDNELDASPRLTSTLAGLTNAGIVLQRISLEPLLASDLTQLVSDTLHCDATHAEPLARLVHQKTGGNPFFVIQFLKLLEREGHLRFDEATLRWVYRIEDIVNAPLADNVIDLMTHSIERLPRRSRYALTLAACIGSRFDAAVLTMVCEQSASATAEDLAPALAENLVLVSSAGVGPDETVTFSFLHDRVQQAAYALIPAERRCMVHLTVGRLLQARALSEPGDDSIFDTIHHLNLGRALIHDPQERRDVASLNLDAGRRAKLATAYDSALQLFQAGIDLLGDAAWDSEHALCFELHLEAAIGLYLCGAFEPLPAACAALLLRARTPIESVRVLRLRSMQYERLGQYSDALASTSEGLALLGLVLPRREDQQAAALLREIELIKELRGGREIAALIDLPLMTDASIKLLMSILVESWAAAYLTGAGTLTCLISAAMVRLSLEHGNVEESAYGYVTHAITVGPQRGDYAAAYQFGRLALAVNERLDDKRLRAKIHHQFQAHVNLWCQPLQTSIAYAQEAYRSGIESGDFLYAAYGAAIGPWSAFFAGEDLVQFVRDYEPSVAQIDELKNPAFADTLRLILNWARALQRRTVAPLSLTDATMDEADYLLRYADIPFFAGIHAVARLHLCSLLGSPLQAMQAAEHAAPLVAHMPGTIWPVQHEFWHALAVAANFDDLSADAVPAARAVIEQAAAAFAVRAQHCDDNFGTQALLLAAEVARLDGRGQAAADLYEQAIEFASARPLLPMQALAHELYGRFRRARRQGHLAGLHFAQACAGYQRWGAQAKVLAMQQQHPELAAYAGNGVARRGAITALSVAAPLSELGPLADDVLDLLSILKSTHVIADEVELKTLLAQLLVIAIESAGAERGALVLETDLGPRVYTVAGADHTESDLELERSQAVPVGIVSYVRRTSASLVLARADTDENYLSDAYVQRHQPRSVMCMPMQVRGHAVGVLYLEHRRAAGVFTAERQNTLRILAAQAAIAIENMRLFSAMKQENAERRQAQEQLGAALVQVERLSKDLEAENTYLRRDLIANVSHDLRTPLVSLRGYLEVLATKRDALTPEVRDEYLSIAVRQSEHLSTLIDELFELAKLEFKGASLRREAFPLTELADDVIAKFALMAERNNVLLHVDAPEELPFVHADLSLIERVLENLLGNALHHTPAGGRVSITLSTDGAQVVARVADSGSGIASEELPFVFDRYYRGDSAHRTASGAGLGLAITKRILDLHGAWIEVASDSNSGTCFTFGLALSGDPSSENSA